MQLGPGNFRHRGWRESRKLNETGRGALSDLTRITQSHLENEVLFASLATPLQTLAETRVSALQHLRVQLRHRLRGS